jgi:hypothetical protein
VTLTTSVIDVVEAVLAVPSYLSPATARAMRSVSSYLPSPFPLLIQEPLAKALLHRGRAHVLIAKQWKPLDCILNPGPGMSDLLLFLLSVALALVQVKLSGGVTHVHVLAESQALRLSLIKVVDWLFMVCVAV